MAAPDLTTLANVKAYLKIPSGQTNDDAVLSRLVTSASQYIRSWLNRDIDQRTYTDTRDGNDSYKMAFVNYPIVSITSMFIDGLPVPASTSVLVPGYVLSDIGMMIQLRGDQYRFTRGVQNVVVTYLAGYSPVPADIEQACIEMVAFRYKSSDRIGISSKTLAGEVISYSQKDIPANAAQLMIQYRRFFTV